MRSSTFNVTIAAVLLSTIGITSSGCVSLAVASPAHVPPGVVYSNVKGVHPAVRVEASGVRPGPKKGKACATGVVGVAAWGDMSLETAKKNAGITEIDTLDFESFSVLGPIYMKNCLVVTGR